MEMSQIETGAQRAQLWIVEVGHRFRKHEDDFVRVDGVGERDQADDGRMKIRS
jgi:hypothetical protein